MIALMGLKGAGEFKVSGEWSPDFSVLRVKEQVVVIATDTVSLFGLSLYSWQWRVKCRVQFNGYDAATFTPTERAEMVRPEIWRQILFYAFKYPIRAWGKVIAWGR